MSSSYPAQKGAALQYPPSPYDASSLESATSITAKNEQYPINRTPSPTPSELEALKTGALDWKTLANWRFWIRRDWLLYYIIFIVIIVISVLLFVFHTQIVHWLTPVANWFHKFRFGWLVPIGVLFVISFPPLFGHEIVAVLCGLVWGLWVGFGIVCAGTFVGEVGNFYAFKYCCKARGEKLERTKISYACLAKVIREGGFTIALIARLSAIPGHFTTAVFATCGMGIVTFSIAAILSLPKQFVTVYLGVILETSSTGQRDKKSKLISDVVVGITGLITIAAMWWILHKMNKAKPAVIYDRRKARQAKLARAESTPYNNPDAMNSTLSVGFNPETSSSELGGDSDYVPLHQRWDKQGRAIGYSGDPLLYAPQPKRASGVGGPLSQPNSADRYDYSPGAQYDRAPPRRMGDYSWETERQYGNTGSGPTSSGSIPLHPYPSNNARSPKSDALLSITPPGITPQPQMRSAPTQAQQYPLAELSPYNRFPSPTYDRNLSGRGAGSNEDQQFDGHNQEASDDSFVTAVGSHSKASTLVDPLASPQGGWKSLR